MLERRALDQGCVRSNEADERKCNSAALEAVQDAEATRGGREDEELDKAPHETVSGEEDTDAGMVDAESAGELEGELGVGVVGLFLCVHEDWEELVVGYRMQGEDGVCYQVDDALAGEDFAEGGRGLRWFGDGFGGEVAVVLLR